VISSLQSEFNLTSEGDVGAFLGVDITMYSRRPSRAHLTSPHHQNYLHLRLELPQYYRHADLP
jgi:hypothetical protein